MPGETERVGELLVEEGVITHEELARAIAEGNARGTPLGALLESCSHARRAELAAFLASDFRVPSVADLRKINLSADAARLVPEELARKHELIPIARIGDILCVAKANYYNRAAIQELRRSTGLKIKVLQADEIQVRAAIEAVYKGRKGELPAPSARKKETSMRTATGRIDGATPLPSPVHEHPRVDMPLISMPDERKAAAAVAAGKGTNGGGVDEVIEIMDAVRIPSQEYSAALRDPLARLVLDFDDLFHQGKAVTPHRMS